MKARGDSWGGVPVIYWGPVYLWLLLPKLCPFPYNVPKAACMAFWLPLWFLSAPRPSLCFQLFASFAPIGDCFLCDLEKGYLWLFGSIKACFLLPWAPTYLHSLHHLIQNLSTYVAVRGWPSGVGSLLLPGASKGSQSGHQAWQQVPLPSWKSCIFLIF